MREQINKLLSVPLEVHLKDPSGLKAFYRNSLGQDLCGYCPGKIDEAYKKLSSLTDEKIKAMAKKILHLKKDVGIDTYSSSSLPQGYWTKDNITDEIAVKLIDGGYAKFFQNPEDLQEARESVEELKESPEEIQKKKEEKAAKDKEVREAAAEEKRLKKEKDDQEKADKKKKADDKKAADKALKKSEKVKAIDPAEAEETKLEKGETAEGVQE